MNQQYCSVIWADRHDYDCESGRPKSRRAGSLGWLEHPADNREVAGSNPASPTLIMNYVNVARQNLPN